METSSSVADPETFSDSPSSNGSQRRFGLQFSALSFLRSPVSTLLEHSGILRPDSGDPQETEGLIVRGGDGQLRRQLGGGSGLESGNGEVAIRIIGAGEGEHDVGFDESEESIGQIADVAVGSRLDDGGGSGGVEVGERVVTGASSSDAGNGDTEEGAAAGNSNGASSYQRFDIQQLARWVEQILPFSLLLLVVFIREHLQGIGIFHLVVTMMCNQLNVFQPAYQNVYEVCDRVRLQATPFGY